MGPTRALARLAVVIAIVAAAIGVASPAAATPDTCAGSGTLQTQNPLFWLGTSGAGGFNAQFTIGGCLDPAAHSNGFAGYFTSNALGNYCGWATGRGSFPYHDFQFSWVGDTIVVTGDVVGTITIVADSLGGQSCVSGASRFEFVADLQLV